MKLSRINAHITITGTNFIVASTLGMNNDRSTTCKDLMKFLIAPIQTHGNGTLLVLKLVVQQIPFASIDNNIFLGAERSMTNKSFPM